MSVRTVKKITWDGSQLEEIRGLLSFIPRQILALQQGNDLFILEAPARCSNPDRLIATRISFGWICELKELAGAYTFYAYPPEDEK